AVIAGGTTSATVVTAPLGVMAGSDQLVAVAGPNLDQVPIDGIDLGPGIVVDHTSRQVLNGSCNRSAFPFFVVRSSVDPHAMPGGRAVRFTVNGATTALTGGLRILPGTVECAGDCDASGSVDVAELITIVNIALGNQPASTCPAGDTDGSGTID